MKPHERCPYCGRFDHSEMSQELLEICQAVLTIVSSAGDSTDNLKAKVLALLQPAIKKWGPKNEQ